MSELINSNQFQQNNTKSLNTREATQRLRTDDLKQVFQQLKKSDSKCNPNSDRSLQQKLLNIDEEN